MESVPNLRTASCSSAAAPGDVFLVHHSGSTILNCRCTDSAANRLTLLVPVGYGLATGQMYEVRSRCESADGERVGNAWVQIAGLRRVEVDGVPYLEVRAGRLPAKPEPRGAHVAS